MLALVALPLVGACGGGGGPSNGASLLSPAISTGMLSPALDRDDSQATLDFPSERPDCVTAGACSPTSLGEVGDAQT